MKIPLVLLAIAGTILGHASALGDGLNLLNARNVYDQINSQVRTPIISETSGVQSVIESMKDLQKRLQEDQLKKSGGIHESGDVRKLQLHTQSVQTQNHFPSERPIPQMRRQFIQITERVTPSNQYRVQTTSVALNPTIVNEKQLTVDQRSAFDGGLQSLNNQQFYQNRRLESFNQKNTFESRRQPIFQQSSNNNYQQQDSTSQQSIHNSNQEVFNNQQFFDNQQRPIFPQRSYDQETVFRQSYKKETVLPQQSYAGDNQQGISSQRSFSDNQQGTITQRSNNQANQQSQRSFSDNQQGTITQSSNNNQANQQSQRSFSDNQQGTITQHSNNQASANQQSQFSSDDVKLPTPAINDQQHSAVQQRSQQNHQSIHSYQYSGNMESNQRENRDQSSSHVSNEESRMFNANSQSVNEPQKSSNGQLRFGFESTGRTTLVSKDSSEPGFDQNEASKYLPLVSTLVQNSGSIHKGLDSRVKGEASIRQHLKTPFTDYNYSHLL